MWSSVRKNASSASATVALLLMSCAATAAPVSLRSFAAQQMHVASIAYRIGAASSTTCRNPNMLTGMLLHDLSQYDPQVRPAVGRAFSLTTGAGVIQIVPGSAAERAGLRIDDEIVAINNLSIVDPRVYSQSQKSYARTERITKVLETALSDGPAELLIRRGGTLVPVQLYGERACGGKLSLLDSSETNAWSDGEHVVVTTAMTRLANDDDEIAFVIAHEMAHNILGHSHSSSDGIFGFSFGLSRARQSELAADQLAVKLMSDGGYRPTGGIAFLEAARRKFWWASFSLDHPGFGRRIEVVWSAIAAQRARTGDVKSPLTVAAEATAGAPVQGPDRATLLAVFSKAPTNSAPLSQTQQLSVQARNERRTYCDR